METGPGPSDTCDTEQISAPGAIQGWGALLIADDGDLVVRHASSNLAIFLGIPAGEAIGLHSAKVIGQATLRRVMAGAGGENLRAATLTMRPRVAGIPMLAATAHRLKGNLYIELERASANDAAQSRMPSLIQAMRMAGSMDDLFAVAIAELHRIIGYDRVHIYRFHDDGHGEVIAERNAPDMHPLLGLRFPSRFIPPQARAILTRVGMRVIADTDAAPVSLIGGAGPAVTADLALCALRLTAPCCIAFFRDMGLRASVSIALNVNGQLWGIISCHNRAPVHLSPTTRGLCETIGQITSMMLAQLRDAGGSAEIATRRAFFADMTKRFTMLSDDPADLATALADQGAALLAFCDASGAIIRIGGRTLSLGATPGGLADNGLLDSLLAQAAQAGDAPVAWDALADFLTETEMTANASVAGALLLPLNRARGDAITWLRPEQTRTVRWGAAATPSANDATPAAASARQTLAIWQQEIRGRCLPWRPALLDATEGLRRELTRHLAGCAYAMTVARETAERATRAKSEFLATISHEIRSPMSGLLGVLELLRATELDEEQSRMAGMIQNSGSMLLAVLNNVLDFSKIEAGAMSIALESVRLEPLISGLVEPLTVSAAAKGLKVRASIDASIPDRISTDPLRLRQILGNLLSNAIKFSSSGEVTLLVDRVADSPMLRFRVRDTGIGMSAAVIARLFTPFMQADGSTTRDFGGTGLGLCICHQLSRLLGGDLTATSEPGAGSEFTFLMPLLVTACDTVTIKAHPALPPTILPNGRNVLVVDDDATLRWLSRRQLEKLGFMADVAEDGEAALRQLRRGSYDLVLTDCHMPRMDGVALTQAIRADPDPVLRIIPIIGLTADVTEAQFARAIAAGMSELAIKPLTVERISYLLQKHLPARNVTAAATSPSLRAVAFDDQIYLSVFPRGDPEGRAWLNEWIESARKDIGEIEKLLQHVPISNPSRANLRNVAHRLAGGSFSVGAMLLGTAARNLENAAGESKPAKLRKFLATICAEFAGSVSAIASFTGTAC